MKERIKNAILGAFVSDAYTLGAHWVYDPEQLERLSIDWQVLNDPEAMWHKGKQAGDFTHYGDQMLLLLESIIEEKHFSLERFAEYWEANMREYNGYIDGATRSTLENMQSKDEGPKGSQSQDLSICGRIAPLLLIEELDARFLAQVRDVVAMTHNSTLALDASAYFAQVLLDVIKGRAIKEALLSALYDFPEFELWVKEGLSSIQDDTAESIRKFGPACGIDGGFAGTIHLLALEDSFEITMIKNAKAGGDSSARGMIVGMILGASGAKLPKQWLQQMHHYDHIKRLLD